MDKKITDITSVFALGHSYQRKLMTVPSGEQFGRLVALIQTSPTDIKLTWSDSPSSTWSALSTIASEAYDGTFDCVMDDLGNVHLVYSEATTGYLVTRKLTINDSGKTNF